MFASIFLEFHLPNSTTWFYFALPLAIALFYQFQRPFSMRNWDLLALFLYVPGFLLLQQANQRVGDDPELGAGERVFGYAWLLGVSIYWFTRCFLDLGASRRPVFRSNLAKAGLAWFGISLFICLAVVSVRRPTDVWEPVGKQSATIESVTDGATVVVTKGEPVDAESYEFLRNWTIRGLSMMGHAAVVAGLFFIGWRHFRDAETGVAMGTLYLMLPFTAYHISQLHHVLPAALVLWAIYFYRRPRISGWLLGFAAGATFFPALLFPLWLHFYWKRGAIRFAIGFFLALAISLTATLSLLWAAGYSSASWSQQLHITDWQPWKRPLAESLWQGVHWAYRLPIFIVFAAFTVTTFFWPTVKTMSHVAALSAAVLIGVQFWYADRGGLYVLWYVPMLLIVVFRPTTTELEPPLPSDERGWGTRVAMSMWNRIRRRTPQAQSPELAA